VANVQQQNRTQNTKGNKSRDIAELALPGLKPDQIIYFSGHLWLSSCYLSC
jgi:hypothetical protein